MKKIKRADIERIHDKSDNTARFVYRGIVLGIFKAPRDNLEIQIFRGQHISLNCVFCSVHICLDIQLLQRTNRPPENFGGAWQKQSLLLYYVFGMRNTDRLCLSWRKRVKNRASYTV